MIPTNPLFAGPFLLALATSVVTVSGVFLLYPVLPAIMAKFGVDEARVGLVITVFTAPAVVLSPVFGVLADLKGRRILLVVGLLTFGVGGIGGAFAQSFGSLLVCRAVQGVGLSALLPLTIVLISDLLPEHREIDGQGWKVAIDRVAMIALPLAGGLLAALSWRASFIPYGLVCVLAVIAWRCMPETIVDNPGSLRSYLGNTSRAIREPRLRVAYGVGFLRFFLDYGLFTYLPLLLAFHQGATPAVVAIVIAISAGGSILTAISVGRLLTKASSERLLSIAFFASAAALGTIPLLPSVWSSTMAAFIFGLANGLISPLQKNLLTRRTPKSLKGGVVAFDRLIQQIAKSLSPSILGVLIIFSNIDTVFWVLSALGLAGATILIFISEAES
ncbi:MFS transporter [Ensifer aridi]|uniref:MFS transporter n=1 Tax=Ensifer aridi TaxID=1708715 RepID=UPI000A11C625|nr:MFS transporter [Ensifer aridi]